MQMTFLKQCQFKFRATSWHWDVDGDILTIGQDHSELHDNQAY